MCFLDLVHNELVMSVGTRLSHGKCYLMNIRDEAQMDAEHRVRRVIGHGTSLIIAFFPTL